MLKNLFICFIFFIPIAVVAQEIDTLQNPIEEVEVEVPKYNYWEKNYYDSIPKINEVVNKSNQDFPVLIKKYQDKDFEYIESISDKLSIWKTIKKRIYDFFTSLFPKVDAKPADWFWNLLGICGILLVIFLIYKFLFSGRQFLVLAKDDSIEDSELTFVENNLLQVDIDEYIKQAIIAEKFSLAIRYYQLLNIQLLAKKDVVIWNKNKTNLELADEIKQEDLKKDFNHCSALFDYVWFGDFVITKDKFNQVVNEFQEFQRRWS